MFDEKKFIADFIECYETTNMIGLLKVFKQYFHIFISDNTNEMNKSIVEHFFTKDEVIHAESNAIAKLAKSSESGDGSTMFLTHSPCIQCAKQIYTTGIKKIYYKQDYRNSDGIEFLKKCGIEVLKLNEVKK